ncbi:MAG: hypothetical protein AB7T48_04660 [Solirubrobacterales bacterium]
MRDQSSGGGTGVVREDIEICDCTNTQLERGETCGLAICPNNPANRHPRLDERGEPVGAVPTEEGRTDDLALELLEAEPSFDRPSFTWVGSEHLGGGLFCASIYTGRLLSSPYIWITEGDETGKFYVCLYVATSGDEEPEEPRLSTECGADDLYSAVLRMLAEAKKGGEPK